MTNPISPRWRLVQVGDGRAPQSNAATDITVEHADARDNYYNGTFDWYACSRAPLTKISFTHTGEYRNCESELDIVKRATARYVPCLFMRTPDVEGGCPLYAWAFGRITVKAPWNIGMHRAGGVGDITITGELKTPLREVHYQNWRFGVARTYTNRTAYRTQMENESFEAESPAEWSVPCMAPIPGPERWWYRDVYLVERVCGGWFDSSIWDVDEVDSIDGLGGAEIVVDGSYAPRTITMVREATLLTIKNDFGKQEFRISYPQVTNGAWIVTDSDDLKAWQKYASGGQDIVDHVRGVSSIPRLEVGRNIVMVDQGAVVIGHARQWY